MATEKTRFANLVDRVGISKAIEEVLADRAVHFFTQDIIRKGMTMDPLDAYYDAALATEVLRAWLDHVIPMGRWPRIRTPSEGGKGPL